MIADLWYLVGYVGAFLAIHTVSNHLYRENPTLGSGDPFPYPHRWWIVLLFVIGSASFGLLVFLGGWIVATFAFDEAWLGSVHAIGLAVALGRLSFHLSAWLANIRLVSHGFKKRWVAAPRGGWRSRLEWALVLAFVAVTGTELVLHLLP
jgi:hypothetical protein